MLIEKTLVLATSHLPQDFWGADHPVEPIWEDLQSAVYRVDTVLGSPAPQSTPLIMAAMVARANGCHNVLFDNAAEECPELGLPVFSYG